MHRRSRGTWAVFALVAGALGVLVPLAYAAQLERDDSIGGWEIEGDLTDDTTDDPAHDWEDLFDGTLPATFGVNAWGPDQTPPELAGTTADDGFVQGSKWQEPEAWTCGSTKSPGKDDIVEGAAVFHEVDGDQWIDLYFTRLTTNGDAHVDFELSQSAVAHPRCPDLSERVDGDLVIAYDTENGGKIVNVTIKEWDAPSGKFVSYDPVAGTAAGAVNIPHDDANFPLAPGAFGEAAINLSANGFEVECGDFSTIHMQSRASTSPSAAAKDYTKAIPIDVGCPDVVPGKQASQSSVTAGDGFVYTLTATNVGGAPADGVVMFDDLVETVTITSATFSVDGGDGQDCDVVASTNEVTCTVGELAPGSQAVATIEVTVGSEACGSIITNESEVRSSNELESDQANNTSETVIVEVNCSSPMVTKSADSEIYRAGDTATFVVTGTNAGSGAAADVVITDPLDGRFTDVVATFDVDPDAAGGTGTCTVDGDNLVSCDVGSLAANDGAPGGPDTVVVTITATVPGGDACGSDLHNTAFIEAANGPGDESDPVTISVLCGGITKIACPSPDVAKGGIAEFDIFTTSFTSGGTATVVDTIPDGTSVRDADGGTVEGDTITWTQEVEAGDGPIAKRIQLNVPASLAGAEITNAVDLYLDGVLLESDDASVTVTDTEGASASGVAWGLDVTVFDAPVVDEEGRVDSSAPSGASGDDSTVEIVDVPDLATVNLNTNVTGSMIHPVSTGFASSELAYVDLLGGAITASGIKGVSRSDAGPFDSTFSSDGSHIDHVQIGGIVYDQIVPNTRVTLDGATLGLPVDRDLVEVVLYEEYLSEATFTDAAEGLDTFASGHGVNMIHVTVLESFDLGGTVFAAGAEIIVGHAETAAAHPSGRPCSDPVPEEVAADALSVRVTGALVPQPLTLVQEGAAAIGPFGGSSTDFAGPVDSAGTVTASEATNTACGSIVYAADHCELGQGAPFARATSSLEDLDVLDGMLICDAVDTSATARADGTTEATAQYVDCLITDAELNAIGIDTSPSSAPIVIADAFRTVTIKVNEQITNPDGSITVNAFHIWIQAFDPTVLGVVTSEIVIAQSHAGAWA